MFVTSSTYTGNLGGLDGADAKCNALAEEAELPGTYKAWLSTTTVNAKDRIADSTLGFQRVDGEMIAANLSDLIDWEILNPISRDEYDATVTTSVWTGTNESGNKISTSTCQDWTYELSDLGGGSACGNSGASDFRWTFSIASYTCGTMRPFYCIQQSAD
jgi:hypothetical protein